MITYVQLRYVYRALIAITVLMLLAAMLTQAKADAQISPSQYEFGKPFSPEITQATCGGKNIEIISKFTPLNADHEIARVSSQEIWIDRDGKKVLMARYRFDPQVHEPLAISSVFCEPNSGKNIFITMLAKDMTNVDCHAAKDCSWGDYFDVNSVRYIGTPGSSEEASLIENNYHQLTGRVYRALPERYERYEATHPLDVNSISVNLPTVINRRSFVLKFTTPAKVTYQSVLQCWDANVRLETRFFNHTVEQTLNFGMKETESSVEITHADAPANYLGGLICVGKNNNRFVEAWSWKHGSYLDVNGDYLCPDCIKKDIKDKVSANLVLRIFSLNGTLLVTIDGNHIVPASSNQDISSLNRLGSDFFINHCIGFWVPTTVNSMDVDGRAIDVGVDVNGKEWFDEY